MAPVGPITHYIRRFLDDRDNAGFSVATCGFRGWTVREFPNLGLKCSQKLRELPFHEEIQLFYAKLYRVTRSDEIVTHPTLTMSHYPFLMLGEFLARCVDKRIASRSCNFTKVRSCKLTKISDIKYILYFT